MPPWRRVGVVSLLEMLDFSVQRWLAIGESLKALSNRLSPEHIAASISASAEDRNHVLKPLEQIAEACRELGLSFSEGRAMELIERWANVPTLPQTLDGTLVRNERSTYECFSDINYKKPHPSDQLVQDVEFLRSIIFQEMSGCKFFGLLPLEAGLYMKSSWIGPEVLEKFPSVEWEAAEAATCIALDRDTACVFHCMRVLEWGLASLAHALNVPPNTNPNWYQVLNACRRRIKEPANRAPEFRSNEQFYNTAAIQFDHFRLALRNHVAHAKEKYSHLEARSVMDHVGVFMRVLSTRLGEVPLPGVSLGPDEM